MTAGRLKVLVSAYACDPARGSEDAVGWGWTTAAARNHDLWVIAGEHCGAAVEAELRRQPELQRQMRFYFLRQRRLPWLERLWPPLEMLTYVHQWQRAAYRLGRRLHGAVHFDLVHQLTYVGYRAPGFLWKLDVPFVWGPIGGLENTPWRLLPAMGLRGCAYYTARNVINALQRRFWPGPKRAFRKARGSIIAATEGMRRGIRRWYGEDSHVVCEVGWPPAVATEHSLREHGRPFRMAWRAVHEPGKALPLLLEAVAALPRELDWELDVLGQGSCTGGWRRLAHQRNLDGRCRWHGWVARDAGLKVVRRAHAFVSTSLKDLTSTVLLEALASGVPVICPDHCGFSDVVTDDCGVRVPVPSVRAFRAGLRDAIVRLADDEHERRRLAAGALRRIVDFSWDKKAATVDQIYRGAMEQWQPT